MTSDLGIQDGRVQHRAGEVLGFWFHQLTPDRHFANDPTLDRTIADRFGEWRDDVLASGAAAWRGDSDTLLAAILLLDQFSRNIHRDTPRAFEGDALALSLARDAIAKGWDGGMADDRRAFLYMPFMHGEDMGVQRESVRLFEALGNPDNLAFARDHAQVVERFGRFPSRNAALDRDTTDAERDYLNSRDAEW